VEAEPAEDEAAPPHAVAAATAAATARPPTRRRSPLAPVLLFIGFSLFVLPQAVVQNDR
jgi:hypothetical protein